MIPNAYRMFNFDLGETADALRETVLDFASNEIAPRAAEIDKSNQFPIDKNRMLLWIVYDNRILVLIEQLDLLRRDEAFSIRSLFVHLPPEFSSFIVQDQRHAPSSASTKLLTNYRIDS